jgi:hypothetical protein
MSRRELERCSAPGAGAENTGQILGTVQTAAEVPIGVPKVLHLEAAKAAAGNPIEVPVRISVETCQSGFEVAKPPAAIDNPCPSGAETLVPPTMNHNDSSRSQPVPAAEGSLVAAPTQDPDVAPPAGAKTTTKLVGLITGSPNWPEKLARST